MTNNFKTRDERLLVADLIETQNQLLQLVEEFTSAFVPGPRQRRLAKAINDITNEILSKEQELVRIRRMSLEYSRRRS